MSKVYQLAASEVVHVLVAGEINLMKNLASAGSGRETLPNLMTRYCKTACIYYDTIFVPHSPSSL